MGHSLATRAPIAALLRPPKTCQNLECWTLPYRQSSTLGTKGGPRTNSHAAVLDVDGQVIPGLYAAGNVMAGPTGMVYGGAGGTLGPAMVFGFKAGRHAAERARLGQAVEA